MTALKNLVTNPGAAYIVAELNTSHRGKMEVAKETILAAKEAGADAVKFQSWNPQSLFTPTYLANNQLEDRFYQKFSLSSDQLGELFEFANSLNIDASSTAYTENEIAFLASCREVPFIKIASMDLTNVGLISSALRSGKPTFISTGLSSASEVEATVREVPPDLLSNLIVFHCTSVYPTPLERSALGNITWLRSLSATVPVGYSDHTIGSSAALIAVGLGVRVFEKHFSLDTSKPGFDNQMAADFDQFCDYVRDIREGVMSVSETERALSISEQEQAKKMRRSAFAANDILGGSVLRKEDLMFRRPGSGLGHSEASPLVGKTAIRTIHRDTMISTDMFAN